MGESKLLHEHLTKRIIASAIYVHLKLGPGLLEEAYQRCLFHHLTKSGLEVRAQVPLPLQFDELLITRAYRIDMIVENTVMLELKAIEKLAPIHIAQAITYLKFSGLDAGLIINFNSIVLRDGLKRVFNNGKQLP